MIYSLPQEGNRIKTCGRNTTEVVAAMAHFWRIHGAFVAHDDLEV
jgi:hypothetical protein